MTALLAPWPLLCIGLWTAIVGTLIFFGHRLEQVRPTVAEPEPEVVRLDWLPPVPPPTTPPFSQTVPSADWFFDIPADCLSDDAIRALSDDIAANFRVIGGAA